MLLRTSESLPEGPNWSYELKLDGYRAIAVKTAGQVRLRSRNDNDFNRRYPAVVKALATLPDETVVDGEIVALDESGRPSFNILQNYGFPEAPIIYYIFDLLILAGRDLKREPLTVRRRLLESAILPILAEPLRHSPELHACLPDLVNAIREQRLEGLIAKRRDSLYEPGQRSGAWLKMRVNQGREFVIGGYMPGAGGLDALIFGYYEGKRLLYCARTRSGFNPRLRLQLLERLRDLETPACPFANLPEARSGRWGDGLTPAKMAACRWVKPTLVGQFEFVEWTPDNHLRHPRFIALRDDKRPREITRAS